MPIIPGLEGAGIIATVGSGVKGLEEGEPLGLAWLRPADECHDCNPVDFETLCPQRHALSEAIAAYPTDQIKGDVPHSASATWSEDSAALAPILCAAVTSYKGLRETWALPGEWVVVSDISGLGSLGIQYAKGMGLRVVALDSSDSKLSFARALGADIAVNPFDIDGRKRVLEATHGGAHAALLTGLSRTQFRQTLVFVRRRGTVCVAHLPIANVPTPAFDVAVRRVTLRSPAGTSGGDFSKAVMSAAAGVVDARVEYLHADDASAE